MNTEPTTIARHLAAEAMARDAGALALSFFRDKQRLGTRLKGAQDFLTEADGAVEALLRATLTRLFPDDGFLGEEGGGADARRLWVVDPIDGTANFARGQAHWSVSIGYLVDGVPQFGVVYLPASDELFSARRGAGARCNYQSIHVSETVDAATASVEIGWSAKTPPDRYLATVRQIMLAGASPRRGASGSLGLCYVAAGRSDAYIEHFVSSWDVAAGIVIAEEAGAKLSEFFVGNALLRGNSIWAATPDLAPLCKSALVAQVDANSS